MEVKLTKMLFIRFVYNDGATSTKSVKKSVKYYEDNGRGTVKIEYKITSMRVPFDKEEFKEAKTYVRERVPPGYDCYVMICNPRRSRIGGKFIATHQSSVNMIHEIGHFFNFAHSSSVLGGVQQSSRDPFDQMTIFGPYPSTNAPHRVQNNWLLDGELVSGKCGTYEIGMLKNFEDRTTVKIIKSPNSRRYYISYGVKKNIPYVVVHTVYGKKSTFIIGMYKLEKGKEYYNERSEISIKCLDFNNKTLKFELKVDPTEESDDDLDECSDVDNSVEDEDAEDEDAEDEDAEDEDDESDLDDKDDDDVKDEVKHDRKKRNKQHDKNKRRRKNNKN